MESLKDRLATLQAQINAIDAEVKELLLEKSEKDAEINNKLIKLMDSSDGKDAEIEECIDYTCKKSKETTKSLGEKIFDRQEQLTSLRKSFENFQQAFERYQTNALTSNAILLGTPVASSPGSRTQLSYRIQEFLPRQTPVNSSFSNVVMPGTPGASPSVSTHISYRSPSVPRQVWQNSDNLTIKCPTIIKSDDDHYYELRCLCGVNARVLPGGSMKFLAGIAGLTSHLSSSLRHDEYEEWRSMSGNKPAKSFIMENCARRLSEQEVNDLVSGRNSITMITLDASRSETPQPYDSAQKRKRHEIVEDDEGDELVLEERRNRRALSYRVTESPLPEVDEEFLSEFEEELLSEIDEELSVRKLNSPLEFRW